MFKGYMAIGGEDGVGAVELFNAERTYAYASHLIPALGLAIPDAYQSPDLRWLLGHEDYGSPLSDQAIWTDPDDPASFEFLGFMPTEVTGLENSTWESPTVEFVQDGGVALSGRRTGREIRVKGLMIASSQGGMSSGMSWLRNVLSDTACRDSSGCGGERLIVLSASPEVCDDVQYQVSPVRVHPCLAPYVRQFYRVQATSGVKVRNEWSTPCGPMYEVEFLLYAGVPQPHRLPEFVGRAQNEALRQAENLFTDPSFEDEAVSYSWDGPSATASTSTRYLYGSAKSRNLVVNPEFEDSARTDWGIERFDQAGDPVTDPGPYVIGRAGDLFPSSPGPDPDDMILNVSSTTAEPDFTLSYTADVQGGGYYWFTVYAGQRGSDQSVEVEVESSVYGEQFTHVSTGSFAPSTSSYTRFSTYFGVVPSGATEVRLSIYPSDPSAGTLNLLLYRVALNEPLQRGDRTGFNGYFDGSYPGSSSIEAQGPFVTTSQSTGWSDTRDHSLKLEPVRDSPRTRVSYALNPSLESDGSDWSVVSGGTGSRSSAMGWDGSHSYAVDAAGGEPVVVDIGMATVPTQYTALSMYLNTDAAAVVDGLLVQFDLVAGGTVVGSTTQSSVSRVAGGWSRVGIVLPIPSAEFDTVRATVSPSEAGSAASWQAGDLVYFDAVVVEDGTTAGTYFDGGMPDTDNITYSWRSEGGSLVEYQGIVTSNRTYVDITDGQQLAFGMSPMVEYYLSAVIRMMSSQATPVSDWARTIQVVWEDTAGAEHVVASGQAPNTGGDHAVELRFSLPYEVVSAKIRLYGGGKNATWWDSVLLTSGDRTVYFDGSLTDAEGWYYSWAGDPDASVSVAEYNPVPPKTVPQQSCDDPDETLTTRRNLFINPGPTTTQGWGKRYNNENVSLAFVDDDSRRPGGVSREVTLDMAGSGGDPRRGTFDLRNVGSLDSQVSRPGVRRGATYTASVYVKAEVDMTVHADVAMFAAADNVTGLSPGQYVSLSPGVWTRLVNVFTTGQDDVFANLYVSGNVSDKGGAPATVTAWATDALLELGSDVQPYFDGDTTDTADVLYEWVGLPGRSESITQVVSSGDLLVDPDCPPVPAPPQPPVIQVACIDEPAEWTRYSVLVDNQYVPRWGSAVPIITIRTGASEGRQVRIRFYPLVDPSDPYGYEECDFEIEFLLTYLPANAEMVIDGVTHTAMASVGGSDPVSALHLLTGSDGSPYQWGQMVCDRNYVMTVDVAPLSEDMAIFLDVVGRE